MKQALVVIEKIKDDYRACERSSSPYLKRDRYKHIESLKKELRVYCRYKGYNFNELCEKHKI